MRKLPGIQDKYTPAQNVEDLGSLVQELVYREQLWMLKAQSCGLLDRATIDAA